MSKLKLLVSLSLASLLVACGSINTDDAKKDQDITAKPSNNISFKVLGQELLKVDGFVHIDFHKKVLINNKPLETASELFKVINMNPDYERSFKHMTSKLETVAVEGKMVQRLTLGYDQSQLKQEDKYREPIKRQVWVYDSNYTFSIVPTINSSFADGTLIDKQTFSFKTESPSFDIDKNTEALNFAGQRYKTIKVNDQVWMAEPLRNKSKTSIDDKFGNSYGAFYTFDDAVQTAAQVPGWRLPTRADWVKLAAYFGGQYNANEQMKKNGFNMLHRGFPERKEDGTIRWVMSPKTADESADSAFYLWTADDYNASHAWNFHFATAILRANDPDAFSTDFFYDDKQTYRSVRLIKE